ncbi:MAG: imelysin family protein [Pseudomonadota bacterium]
MVIVRLVFTAVALLIAWPNPVLAASPSERDVINTYADIAVAKYEDSLSMARKLNAAIGKLLGEPNQHNLDAARAAWVAARVPYMQTEVYRFGNAVVDDWEGRVNAWPLDEGMIDYVAGEYGTESEINELYVANIVASKQLSLSGRKIDASQISRALLIDTLHEAGGVEANVATGYHAIEFLLWGQDLNGTEPGAGNRPPTDFDISACTGGNCERRAQYLRVAAEILIEDLSWIIKQWQAGGSARDTLLSSGEGQGITAIFNGMGSLTYGELAGERMKLGLILHEPEEEHDCFSDNTHNSHYFNVIGIRNIYLASYTRLNGEVVSGPSPSDLVKAADAETDRKLRAALEASETEFAALKKRAETVEAYDQMLAEGNEAGNAAITKAIDALLAQTKDIEAAIAALNLKLVEFEGSDSLDDPDNIGKF